MRYFGIDKKDGKSGALREPNNLFSSTLRLFFRKLNNQLRLTFFVFSLYIFVQTKTYIARFLEFCPEIFSRKKRDDKIVTITHHFSVVISLIWPSAPYRTAFEICNYFISFILAVSQVVGITLASVDFQN